MSAVIAPSPTIVEDVLPQVDGGRFPVKRTIGDAVDVTAACFAHGHELVACVVQFRAPGESAWRELAMESLGNDAWSAAFTVDRLGTWEYRVAGWVDHLRAWRDGFARRVEPDDIRLNARIGAALVAQSAQRCSSEDCAKLEPWARILREEQDIERLRTVGLDEALYELARSTAPREGLTESPALRVTVDRERARFSTWYELFPRSCAPQSGVHGSFEDVDERLDDIAAMGFDVLYLPPIHPIGREKRKGKNNSVVAQRDDVGSPWAIGSAEGGHTAIHPHLGTHADFRHLLMATRARGMEIALDIAFQCAPDHPWVKEHPAWFRTRPDGSIQYAENPPKKYQDIYPIDFDTADWKALWNALRDVFLFWVGEGVQLFRVDNPHTKPFPFWEWVIAEVKRTNPEVLFLSEAFTRPHVMHRLSKLGFTQSYTYFTWRGSKAELVEYFTELSQDASREFFRPNVWPNTPDILPFHLHNAGLPMFRIRYVLAATLAANIGIYGPAYELGENRPFKPDSEEYLDSEKYQLRHWDTQADGSLRPMITALNHFRRQHRALQSDWSLVFHPTDNDALLAYSKQEGDDRVLVVVNLDPGVPQAGFVSVDLEALGFEPGMAYALQDLFTSAQYTWYGSRNFVRLDPAQAPAHVFTLKA